MVLIRTACLIGLLLTAGCSKVGLLNALIPSFGVERTVGVPYASGPRHTLDIYRPKNPAKPLPMIVFIYGGNWQTGDKDMYPFVALPLARRGAVVIVPDYRLAPEVQFPAFLQDNAAAVTWAVRHAAELGADPHSIFLMGHSAGAYNAAMLALNPHWLEAAGTSRTQLAGMIGLAGPYDFLPITEQDLIPIFAPAGDGPQSQPVTFADGHNPPLLLLAGTDDNDVRPANTESLARHVAEHGGPVESKLYPGIGHIGLVTAFAWMFRWRAPVLDNVWSFVQRHLGDGAPVDTGRGD